MVENTRYMSDQEYILHRMYEELQERIIDNMLKSSAEGPGDIWLIRDEHGKAVGEVSVEVEEDREYIWGGLVGDWKNATDVENISIEDFLAKEKAMAEDKARLRKFREGLIGYHEEVRTPDGRIVKVFNGKHFGRHKQPTWLDNVYGQERDKS